MKEIVLGLLGLGNIGGGVWDLIREFGDETAKRTGVKLRVKKALVLDKKIHGGKEVPDEVLTTDKDDILEDPEIQIVCEFLGGWLSRSILTNCAPCRRRPAPASIMKPAWAARSRSLTRSRVP